MKTLVVFFACEVVFWSAAALLWGPDIDPVYLPVLAWICIAVFFVHLVVLALTAGVGIVSMPFLYLASLSLYLLGPYILYLELGPVGLVYFRAIDYGYLTGCLPLIMIAVAAFSWGVLTCSRRTGFNRTKLPANRRRVEVTTTLLALCLIGLSFLIIALDTARGAGLKPMLSGNYHDYSDARTGGSQSRLFIASMTWFLPIAALTCNAMIKSRVRRLGWSDFLFLGLMSILLVAGDRGTLLACFAGWLIIHQAICRNVTPVKLLIVACAVMVFVPLMEVMRGLAAADWSLSLMLETARNLSGTKEKFADSTLLTSLGPFSPSLMTLMGTRMRVADGETLRLGSDYLGNILAAIPFNSGAAPNNSNQIHQYLIPSRKGGPGFMAISEMYLNFHVFGIAAGHAILGRILTRMHYNIRTPNISTHAIAFSAVFFFTLMIWVRNEFSFVAQICFLWAMFFWIFPHACQHILPWKNRTANQKAPRSQLYGAPLSDT
ncbi:O-antigen polysaccharide polymerase Wzy [Ruegeria atlantica]|uniref:O-antigen polysaccharide polymerase Wzy n=1 Tax=Ruegeria atlantica TaxID=81569 RepID=UPI00147E96E4|nr:O-antigen polysaccharide polymerase Wzy [Ruegeria atlantica]